MSFDVRIARPGDAKGVAEVHIRAWQSTYVNLLPKEYLDSLSTSAREVQWLNTIKSVNPFSTDRMVFIAEEKRTREVIGFVMVGANRDASADSDCEIHALYVLADHQHKGVGSALFHAGMEWLQAKAFQRPNVWMIDQPTSRRFLSRMGGTFTGDSNEVEIGGRRIQKIRYSFHLDDWGKAGDLKRTRWHVILAAIPAGVIAEGFTRMTGLKADVHGFHMDQFEVLSTIPSLLILPGAWIMLTTLASPKSGLGVDSYVFWKQGGWVTIILTYVSQVLIRTTGFSELSDTDILFFFYPALLLVVWVILALYSYLIRLLFRRGLYE